MQTHRFIIALALALGAGGAQAQTTPGRIAPSAADGAGAPAVCCAALTEAEALRLALARPEFADLQRARVDEAEADVLAAGTWSNPTLDLERDRTAGTRERSWRLEQPLDLSGRRGLREDAARHRLRAAESDNLARRNGRGAELRHAFHDLLRRQQALRAVDDWVRRFADIDATVARLARAGEVAGYDRRRLARERRSAEARLAEMRAEAERDRARLAALIGRETGAALTGSLLPEPPPPLPALQARLAARPEFAALAARAEAAQVDNAAARNNLPQLAVGIGAKRVDDGPLRENGNIVMLAVTLPLFDRQQAGDRRTAAQAMAARAELAMARQAADGALVGLHRQATQLQAAAARYRAEAVTPSAELVRIAAAAYRAGEASILELLDAYKGALEAELTAIDLEGKARAARIELDHLTGSHPQ